MTLYETLKILSKHKRSKRDGVNDVAMCVENKIIRHIQEQVIKEWKNEQILKRDFFTNIIECRCGNCVVSYYEYCPSCGLKLKII